MSGLRSDGFASEDAASELPNDREIIDLTLCVVPTLNSCERSHVQYDDVEVVERPASIPVAVVSALTLGNQDDGIEVTGVANEHRYIHSRHDCPEFPFAKPHFPSHCEKCYCYICDAPVAQCTAWTLHCKATHRHEKWRRQRRDAKEFRDAATTGRTVARTAGSNRRPRAMQGWTAAAARETTRRIGSSMHMANVTSAILNQSAVAAAIDPAAKTRNFASTRLYSQLNNNGPLYITVQGAGHSNVNGMYVQNGYFEHSLCYIKNFVWENEPFASHIFAITANSSAKDWFISLVPIGRSPVNRGIYTARVMARDELLPPTSGWSCTPSGYGPTPYLLFHDDPNEMESATHDQTNEDRSSEVSSPSFQNCAAYVPAHITVQAAGYSVVNGVYRQDGFYGSSMCYAMNVVWESKGCMSYIFSSQRAMFWYIVIVPSGRRPGSSNDTIMYTAPMLARIELVPPISGWSCLPTDFDQRGPTPYLVFH